MVTEDRVDKCLHYLIDHADEYAQHKARSKALIYTIKSVEAQAFLDVAGGTVREKEMRARASPAYIEATQKYEEAEYNATLLDTKMEGARLVISCWQSHIKASQRPM